MGVSLIAIAAIVASLSVARQRLDDGPGPDDATKEPLPPAASKLNLDQLRAAGM